jgi:Calmodulin-binding
MYEGVYKMPTQQAKHFLETELVRVTTQRDMLKNEYQKLPLHGGRANIRQRKETIEDELDEREIEIASLRLKMKDIGIL